MGALGEWRKAKAGRAHLEYCPNQKQPPFLTARAPQNGSARVAFDMRILKNLIYPARPARSRVRFALMLGWGLLQNFGGSRNYGKLRQIFGYGPDYAKSQNALGDAYWSI